MRDPRALQPQPAACHRPRAATRALVAMVLAVALLGAACGSDDGGGALRGDGSPDAADPADARDVAASGRAFAAGLHRAVAAGETGNFVVSPWIVQDQLGQVRTGATGVSLAELEEVLAVEGMPDEVLLGGLHAVREGVAARRGEQRSDERRGSIVVEHRNDLWIQRGTRLDDTWLDGLASGLGVGVRSIDFRSDPSTAAATVEEWLLGAAVDPTLPEGTVDGDTRLLLPSALRFEAPWARSFPSARTRPDDFTLASGEVVEVPTMRLEAARGLRVGGAGGARAVAIPFLGDDLELLVVWPDEGTLADLEARLDGDVLRSVLRSLRARPVSLHLPRFAVARTLRLDEPLRAMGLVASTDVETADLGAMAPGEPLAISGAASTTTIGVDEEGAGRSAATSAEPRSPDATLEPEQVRVDRAFLFVVHDRGSGAVLQTGRIADPRQGAT